MDMDKPACKVSFGDNRPMHSSRGLKVKSLMDRIAASQSSTIDELCPSTEFRNSLTRARRHASGIASKDLRMASRRCRSLAWSSSNKTISLLRRPFLHLRIR
jgi:hypothetical protein